LPACRLVKSVKPRSPSGSADIDRSIGLWFNLFSAFYLE
jgi:hypothetical protein